MHGHMPKALMADYYGQRASAGLVITERTMIAENTSALVNKTGISNVTQIEDISIVVFQDLYLVNFRGIVI